MRAASLAMAVTLCAFAGCSDSAERIMIAEQHLSMQMLDGWTLTRQGRDTLLTPATPSRQTIVVRSAPRPPGADGRDPASLAASTERVLRALPSATLEPPSRIPAQDFQATRFELRFTPPKSRSTYRRTHVLLVGDTHFFHVIHTAPVDDRFDRDSFDSVVASIREEG